MIAYPAGFISVREAAERIGVRIFGSEWTGKEAAARQGLASLEEWEQAQVEIVPVRGSGAGGIPPLAQVTDPWPHGDPTSPDYQEERSAAERWRVALGHLQQFLAHGTVAGALLYRSTGRTSPLPAGAWLEGGAGRKLAKGRAPDGAEIIVSEAAAQAVTAPAQNVVALVRPSKKIGGTERAAEFRQWVEARSTSDGRPPSVNDCNAWATARGLSREWLRGQRRLLPPAMRRGRGEHT
jgi:hypothetical protein